MGKRNNPLCKSIELDEVLFSTENVKPLKRGWSCLQKTKVMVMAERKAGEGETKKKGKQGKVRFIKMQVVKDLKADTITSIVKNDVLVDSELVADN